LVFSPLFLALFTGCPKPTGEKATDPVSADAASVTGQGSGSQVSAGHPFHWPTDEDVDPDDPVRDMPGWLGRTTIEAPGCWSDTDGVVPETAGCHLHCGSDDGCVTCGEPDGRVIGEACHKFTRVVNGHAETSPFWLIETNPGAGVCHPHTGGEGHPEVFDCDAFCKGTINPDDGQLYASGACESVPHVCGGGEPSARCACVAH
jgi:hypothetical protein